MSKKMLIDARHPEETRVALLSGGRVEDFDFESQARMPLRGNIYLARVTRVEPSLQAAFVEYGGNRHGFLAFSEIHSDYYQIPVSDREILREAEALEAELAEKLAELDQSAVDDVDEDEPRAVGEEPEGDQAAEAKSADSDNDGDDRPSRGRGRRRRGGRGRGRNRRRDSGNDSENGDEASTSEASDAGDDTSNDADATAVETAEATTDAALEAPEAPDAAVADSNAEEIAASVAGDDDASALVVEADEPVDAAPSEAEAETDVPNDDDKGPSSIALSAPNDPFVTQALAEGDDDDNAGSSSDVTAEDNSDDTDERAPLAEPETALDSQPAEEATAGANADQPGSADDASTDTTADKVEGDEATDTAESEDAETEDEAPEEPKELSEEEIAARERAAEIADLKRRYEDARREREKLIRNYRIQEVIKRRQILLIQVVKEERGNKGAALTTYLSLAGRYGVLMPNNARGGGVSRKITNATDRKRLRKAISELKVPKGQGLIIRTAGAKRTKAEIKRDYDYLARLWDTIREQTLQSVAPCLIYEEANLIKRAIRDLYNKDTDEILVEGDESYRTAKDFMKMLMPSHAKNVQPYRERMPLFLRHDVERQLDEMYQPVVTLKSGGYLVIQQTEALISIDVNSGKATKERNVEATALKTNTEAAVEVARQCRLRDLAGLLVIDFIDMEENRNNRAVEKKLKEAMKTDRARIQIGNISGFGLMEMSRQRRRSGIVDGTTRACPTCDGAGVVRSVEMAALRILRSIEEAAVRDRAAEICATTCHEVAIYILNNKRSWLNRIEETYKVSVEILSDSDKAGDQYDITKRGKAPDLREPEQTPIEFGDASNEDEADTADAKTVETDDDSDADGDERKPKRRRRRRRGRKGDDEGVDAKEDPSDDPTSDSEENAEAKDADADDTSTDTDDGDDGDEKPKRRRRGKRGGRRSKKKAEGDAVSSEDSSDDESPTDADTPTQPDDTTSTAENPVAEDSPVSATVEVAAPQAKTADEPVSTTEPETAEENDDSIPVESSPEPIDATAEAPAEEALKRQAPPDTPKPSGPKRGGWWQRAFKRD